MSDNGTKKMLSLFAQTVAPTSFLTGFSSSPAEAYHNSESVELDVLREEEDVAVAIQNVGVGYRLNEDDKYTNKEFVPPVFKEAISVDATKLLKRQPGDIPFKDPQFQAAAAAIVRRGISKIVRKIQRSIELQWSQVFTTGTVTLTDADGNAIYVLDYKVPTTHFPAAGTAWDLAGADPLADLLGLSNTIRNNGKKDVKKLIFGGGSWEAALKIDSFKERLKESLRFFGGQMVPMREGGNGGGNFRGYIEIENYKYEMWSYGGRYIDPQTGNPALYVPDDKVIQLPSDADLSAITTFGAIPRFAPLDARVLKYLPNRVRVGSRNMDMFLNAWITQDNENLMAGVGARPLALPRDVGCFGCLDTGI